MNLNDVDLEARLFYRLIKVLHVFFMATLSLVPILISAEPLTEHNWINALMILVIGFSLSYFIPTLIKKTLLYIAYGKKIVVFSDRFITLTSLVSDHVFRVLKTYPTVIYFTGICFFYTLAFLFNMDAFFTLAGLWMLGYPLIKFILLCKKAFICKDDDAQDKLWSILGYTVTVCFFACCKGLYVVWTTPQYYYIFDTMLKCIKYVGDFFGIVYCIYIIWLLKKILINRDRKALKDFMWSLIGVAIWVIIFLLYDLVKSKNLNFHLWHFKPLVSHFSW